MTDAITDDMTAANRQPEYQTRGQARDRQMAYTCAPGVARRQNPIVTRTPNCPT